MVVSSNLLENKPVQSEGEKKVLRQKANAAKSLKHLKTEPDEEITYNDTPGKNATRRSLNTTNETTPISYINKSRKNRPPKSVLERYTSQKSPKRDFKVTSLNSHNNQYGLPDKRGSVGSSVQTLPISLPSITPSRYGNILNQSTSAAVFAQN